MYVRIYVCMHACMYLCMHVCMYVHVHTHTRLHMYTYIYVYIYIHDMCLCIHICTYGAEWLDSKAKPQGALCWVLRFPKLPTPDVALHNSSKSWTLSREASRNPCRMPIPRFLGPWRFEGSKQGPLALQRSHASARHLARRAWDF